MDATDTLILQHQDYVNALARGISKKLPKHVDFEDLVSLGQIGLITAAKQFEPGRGVAFTTFAYYRVRGAIFDGLRSMAGLPPPVRKAVARLDAENQTAETVVETTAGSDDPEFLAKQVSTAIGRLGSIFLLAKSAEDGGGLEPADTVTPADTAEAKESLEVVRRAVLQLPAEQRDLLRMLYFEDKSTTDIAKELGKNKSTISRRHADAIDALRNLIAPEMSRAASEERPTKVMAAPRATPAPIGAISPHAALLRGPPGQNAPGG